MEASDQSRILTRLQELVSVHGKHWSVIAEIMEKEGIREHGKILTPNALRKRYKKLSEPEQSCEASDRTSEKKQGGFDSDQFEKTRLDSSLKEFEGGGTVPAGSSEEVIASLIVLSKKLLEQIQESNRMMERLEKRIEGQASHTVIDSDMEQPITSRDLLELLKEITTGRVQMMHLEEETERNKGYPSREEVLELLEETVQERVENELKTMLSEQGSFSKQLGLLIDRRLKTLFSGGEPVAQTTHAGPGRGKKGKTHKKFSASLEEGLFNRVKSLPGQFSGHLSNALEAYLSIMEEKKRD